MLDFLKKNKDLMLRGTAGYGVQSVHIVNEARNKWCQLAKIVNAVENGHRNTPVGWRKYWKAYGHKIKRKAKNCRDIEEGQSAEKYVPLTDLELRILKILPKVPNANNTLSSYSATSPRDLDSGSTSQVCIRLKNIEEDAWKSVVYMIKAVPIVSKKQINRRKKVLSVSGMSSEHFSENNEEDVKDRSISPPPQWALYMEECRIGAQERTANALETIAALMTAQEERRAVLDERIFDAVTTIATTVQELSTRIQDTLQHLNTNQLDTSGPDIKDHSYL